MDMADNERSVIDQYLGSTGPFPGYSLARSTNRCMKEIEFIENLAHPSALAWSPWGQLALVFESAIHILVPRYTCVRVARCVRQQLIVLLDCTIARTSRILARGSTTLRCRLLRVRRGCEPHYALVVRRR